MGQRTVKFKVLCEGESVPSRKILPGGRSIRILMRLESYHDEIEIGKRLPDQSADIRSDQDLLGL